MTASQMLHFPGVEVDCGIALAATQLLTRHGMGLRFEVKSLTAWYLDICGNGGIGVLHEEISERLL